MPRACLQEMEMANAGWRFLEHGMPAATPVAATKYTAGRPAGDMRFKRIFGEHQRLARLVYGTTAMPWRARETIGGEHLAACVQHQRVYIPCAALPFSDHRLRKVFVLAQRADVQKFVARVSLWANRSPRGPEILRNGKSALGGGQHR